MTRNNTAGVRSALLAAIAVTTFLLPAPVARAQKSITDALLACDRLSEPSNRLACLNVIVRRLKAAVVPEAAATEGRARPPVADSDPAAAETSRPAETRASSLPEDFGLKKKLKPEGKKKQAEPVLTAKVIRHWENSLGRLVVQLDNDQIWTELVSKNARIPRGEVTVKIKPGRFGGWRMRINDNVRVIKVKRLK